MVSIASVIIYARKAYVPTSGKTPDGLYVISEPVYTVDIDRREIVSALEKVIASGHPALPRLSVQDLQRRKDPLLRAAGARSYRALARSGQSYGILWETNQICVIPSTLDKQGRWVDDYSKERAFPKDSSVMTIVEAILEDARSRPELGLENETTS